MKSFFFVIAFYINAHLNTITYYIRALKKKTTDMKKHAILGILLIAVLSVAATFIAQIPAVKSLSISALIVGILIGMVYANTLRHKLPADCVPGLNFCSKRLLRIGIVLYGFRLTLQDVVAVGASALIVDCLVVMLTIALGLMVGKMLKLDLETTLLTSTGSAICGAAAVLGAEPIVRGGAGKTAVAVSTVVIFGTISMFLYPIVYRTGILPINDVQMGVYTGSTLHEVAHVVGAGNAMGDAIATDALIVKMVRVILLVPVLLIMSFVLSRHRAKNATNDEHQSITIPWFAILFLVMICVNTLLHILLPESSFDAGGWAKSLLKVIEVTSTFLLTMAMTALGADTSFSKFRAAGAKPFMLAGIIYIWLIVGGFAMSYLLVR